MTIKGIDQNFNTELHLTIFKVLNIIFKWGLTVNDLKALSILYDKNEELRINILDHKNRMAVLFSSDTRKELISKLNIPYNSFNNSLLNLRKKGFIEKNSLIESSQGNNPWGVSIDKNDYKLIINFNNESNKSIDGDINI